MTFAEKSISFNFISLKSIHCVVLLNSMLGLLQGRKKKFIFTYLGTVPIPFLTIFAP